MIIVPAAPSSISSTRRRISGRINVSPISAEPIINARRCAARAHGVGSFRATRTEGKAATIQLGEESRSPSLYPHG
jgi:hypothetical protein